MRTLVDLGPDVEALHGRRAQVPSAARTANPERGITEIWHRPGFDIDEDALAIGVHIMSLTALDLLHA